MPDIQHSSIPDAFLHEAKHAEQAQENTFLRAKGDGTTEFVFLTLDSFQAPTLIKDDTDLVNKFDVNLRLGKQYVIMLNRSADVSDYLNDVIDLRGMTTLPVGTGKLLSVGGSVQWQNGELSTTDASWNFFRVVEIN